MKLKKFKQILKLYLLHLRTYENISVKNTSSSFLTDFNLIQMTNNLKKVLYTIFEYHKTHKKILFVGLPKKLALEINKLTRHIAVDSNNDLRGFTSNFIKNEVILFSKAIDKQLVLKLAKKPDLIVQYEKKQNTFIQINKVIIPVIDSIAFRKANVNDVSIKDFNQNLSLTSDKSLFCLGLHFLFKRIKKK